MDCFLHLCSWNHRWIHLGICLFGEDHLHARQLLLSEEPHEANKLPHVEHTISIDVYGGQQAANLFHPGTLTQFPQHVGEFDGTDISTAVQVKLMKSLLDARNLLCIEAVVLVQDLHEVNKTIIIQVCILRSIHDIPADTGLVYQLVHDLLRDRKAQIFDDVSDFTHVDAVRVVVVVLVEDFSVVHKHLLSEAPGPKHGLLKRECCGAAGNLRCSTLRRHDTTPPARAAQFLLQVLREVRSSRPKELKQQMVQAVCRKKPLIS
mmetsp:Transcript_35225/g.71919  ORF Transcript_35225/g.71919 Transcript_35225/m.71919 type:complete len:263 (-) Transcript_35225:929-1717(-)